MHLELQLAAAAGQKLLETNLSLRQRHASLVTKTSPFLNPATAGTAPAPGGQGSDSAQSPDITPLASPLLLHPQTPFQRHSRRISTSPAQLAILSSQNEELLQALAKLQDETNSANLEGKQKLRKLEKEIAGLRAELDQSQLKNGELEQKIDSVQQGQERHIELKRQEREAKAQELRASISKQESNPQTFANFAPTSRSPEKPNFVKTESTKEEEETGPITRPPLVPFPSSDLQAALTGAVSPQPSEPSAELVVLSQLLSKIQELESTNREILQRHRETDDKLRNATSRSDALQKVYENLEDEIDAYADDEAGTFSADQSPNVNGQSPLVPFRGNFKGRGVGFLYPPSHQRVGNLRERGSPVPSLRGRPSKESPRFFDESLQVNNLENGDVMVTPETPIAAYAGDVEEGERTSMVSSLKPKRSKRRLRPKVSLGSQALSNNRSNATHPVPPRGLRSIASFQGLSRTDTPIPPRSVNEIPTLWSELNDTGEIRLEASVSKEELALNFEGPGEDDDLEEHTVRQVRSEGGTSNSALVEENHAVTAIRAALDPRNAGRLLQDGEHILPLGSLEGSPAESFFLLSHAVEARPVKWIVTSQSRRGLIRQGMDRMKHMALPPLAPLATDVGEDPWAGGYPEESETDTDRVQTASTGSRKDQRRETRLRVTRRFDSLAGYASDASMRRTAALSRLNDAAVARSSGNRRRRGTRERLGEDGDTYSERERRRGEEWEIERRGKEREVEFEGWGKTLMEIWIILQVRVSFLYGFKQLANAIGQAAIILIVFVYSMARKGPRAILDAAEVKRRPR